MNAVIAGFPTNRCEVYKVNTLLMGFHDKTESGKIANFLWRFIIRAESDCDPKASANNITNRPM